MEAEKKQTEDINNPLEKYDKPVYYVYAGNQNLKLLLLVMPKKLS